MTDDLETRPTDPADDTIAVYANDIPDTDQCMLSIVASRHTFFQISVQQAQVDAWSKEGAVCGKTIELLVAAHPASRVVNRLLDLLPIMTSITDPKSVDEFKTFVYDTLREAQRHAE